MNGQLTDEQRKQAFFEAYMAITVQYGFELLATADVQFDNNDPALGAFLQTLLIQKRIQPTILLQPRPVANWQPPSGISEPNAGQKPPQSPPKPPIPAKRS